MDKLVWVADEYKHHHHDAGWYTGLFLFGIIVVAWSLYTNNVITTVLFVLIVLVMYALSHRQPEKIFVKITEGGVELNSVFYPFTGLKHFWIIYDHERAQLVFETHSLINRHLTIELESQNPEKVSEFVGRYLTELRDREENFIDYLIHRLKI